MSGKKFIQGLLIGLAGAALAFLLDYLGVFSRVENYSWDWRVRRLAAPGAFTDKIRIIAIDQDSLDWMKKQNKMGWPWRRQVYSHVLSFCERAGARAVVFDMLFAMPSVYGPGDDEAFGTAIASNRNYVSALFLSRSQGEFSAWPTGMTMRTASAEGLVERAALSQSNELSYAQASFPIPDVATNAALMGDVRYHPEDGLCRHTSLFGSFDGRFVPSLALAAYCVGHSNAVPLRMVEEGLHVGDTLVPLEPGARALLRFRGRSGTHKFVNAAAVIQSEIRIRKGVDKPTIDPADFKDCYVLFGSTAPGLMDLRPSPMGEIYSGVELHATALDNLLSGDFNRRAPKRWAWALLLTLTLVTGVAGRFGQGAWQVLLCLCLLIPVPITLGFIAYQYGYWLPMVLPSAGVIFSLVTALGVNYALEGRQKRFIKDAFKQYMSEVYIDRLVSDPTHLKLGGELRALTIHFSDLAGFTTISESLKPDVLTALLNEYLTAMTDIIMEEGGTIDKYEGDAIIAFWNAPVDLPGHARAGVRSSLRCQKKLADMRADLKERYGKELTCRIGLNTGDVVVGNMGSTQRFNYTFLGDAGNLASRLEGVNKAFDTDILISENTLKELGDEFAVREVSRILVVGKKVPIRVYQPFFPEVFAARQEMFDVFAAGLKCYYEGRFQEAVDLFDRIAGEDRTAKIYAAVCRGYVAKSPENWDGVWRMTEK